MNLNEYQQEAITFQLKNARSLSYLMAGFAAESGEVLGHYAKEIRDGVNKSDLIIKELGDCLWFIAALADYYDVNLSEVAEGNLSKLADRRQRGVIHGSGDLR